MRYHLIDPSEADRLAAAYIAHRRMKNPEKADHAWAFEKVFDYWRDEPENAWQILLRLTFMPGNSPEDIAYIAAGPAEGLLTHHGEKFVDRFVEMARKEAKFRYLLGGVWKSTMPEQIWSRIQAVSGPPW